MSTVVLALRTYVRYLVPLTLLSMIVFVPMELVALQLPAPATLPRARGAHQLAWVLGGTAWVLQLWLAGAAAPLARSLAAGAPLPQLGALWAGACQLATAAVPMLAALAAIAVGGLALVVPGVMLLVLFSLTATSTARGLTAPLLDSAAIVRANLRAVVLVLAVMLAADLLFVYAHRATSTVRFTKQMQPDQLAAYRTHVRAVVVALVAIAPIVASALAAIRARHEPARTRDHAADM